MSDTLLTQLANLDRGQLLAKLKDLERQRRIVVALIRSTPRRQVTSNGGRKRREARCAS